VKPKQLRYSALPDSHRGCFPYHTLRITPLLWPVASRVTFGKFRSC
jgi:hypothetical protein